ncbi:MAG: IS66 family insertion sequence element accessory protein TnpB [Porphyromonadaceae bacterium]|nr:IS66 family insertion sequence element accessory protein TnpB [Porphyromonadaceae bacterium]
MFSLTGNYNYYINQGSTDMRGGIDKLSYIVRTKMRKDPCSGDVFIFLSKSRKVVKILRAEGNAFVLYEKRLTKERYLRPVYNEETGCCQMSWNSFVLLMQGVVRKELLMSPA